ncbi:hypothetical protein DL771_003481 [Monosporascus sp. 5C6A]|nr:hypothetical protein DL771_003481 [Monosporascus sp. 5C6A]
MPMPAGAVRYQKGILFCSQGELAPDTGGLWYMPLGKPPVPVLTSFFGRPFNSIQNVVQDRDGGLWFTDSASGFEQEIRLKPQLPNHVYRFDPQKGDLRVVADGFGRPTGIAMSPDQRTLYITDTAAARPDGSIDRTLPATIYAFDVSERFGSPSLANRRLFAYALAGVPTAVHCDQAGNVYASCGDGIEVWSPGGMVLGLIEVPVLWTSVSVSLTICFSRLGLRKWKGQRFTQGDYWVIVALVFLCINAGVRLYIGLYGTPVGLFYKGEGSADEALAHLTAQQRAQLVTAGKVQIVYRVGFCIILWSLKMAVVDILRSLLRNLWYYRKLFNSLYCLLFLTFVASFISIFLQCGPLREYWGVHLNSDACNKNDLWLITCESGNILTDTVLLLVPFPVIAKAKIPNTKRVRIIAIFGLGSFLVGVNILRLNHGLKPVDSQDYGRAIWCSIEVGVAMIVANLPAIYILLQPSFTRRRRARRYRPGRPSWRRAKFTSRGATHAPRTTVSRSARFSRAARNSLERGWGALPWNGGFGFDTRITGGTRTGHTGCSIDDETSGILVETELNMEVEVFEMADTTSLIARPPAAKLPESHV